MKISLILLFDYLSATEYTKTDSICHPEYHLWTDSEGRSCEDYSINKYCGIDGTYGELWEITFGSFFDFENDGYTALHCPQCGCRGDLNLIISDEGLKRLRREDPNASTTTKAEVATQPTEAPAPTDPPAIDDCEGGTHHCHAEADCKMIDGWVEDDGEPSHECTCKDGFHGTGYAGEGAYAGTGCTAKVDECAEQTHKCHANAECTDTVEEYTCACNDAFWGDGKECTSCGCDTNAAPTVTKDDQGADTGCTCACNDGFWGDGTTCTAEVNECTTEEVDKKHDCDTNADCADTTESFTCTCKSGEGWFGDGKTCTEYPNADCELDTDADIGYSCTCKAEFWGTGLECTACDCDDNADCANVNSQQSCTCKSADGYFGDGDTCQQYPNADCELDSDADIGYSCTCKAEFWGTGLECTACDCDDNADCANVDSQQSCTCKTADGYFGAGEKGTCKQYPNADCVVDTDATDGFTCTCKDNYWGTGAVTDAGLECTECTCDDNASCTNDITEGSCTCNSGYWGDGSTCTAEVDECSTEAHECHANAVCTDTTQSYTCACKPGYNDPADPADGKECIGDGQVKIAVAIKTNVAWDDKLSDTDSQEFKDAKKTTEDGLKAGFASANLGYDVTVTVTGFTKVGARKRRDTDSNVAQAQVEIGASGDDAGAEFQDTLEQATQTAVDNTAGLSGSVSAVTLVDECSDDKLNDCDANAACTDTVGYYTCTCNSEYWGTGVVDKDSDGNDVPGCTLKFDECADKNDNTCDETTEVCVDTDEKFICQCAEGYARDFTGDNKGKCTKKCELFDIECDVTNGFKITVDTECRDRQYNLDDDDSLNMFVTNVDLSDDTDLEAKKEFHGQADMQAYLSGISDECKFKKVDEAGVEKIRATVEFDQCGGFFVHSAPTAAPNDPDATEIDYTVFTTFVNHRQTLSGVWVSRLDQTQLECRLQHVEVDSKDEVDISENDENDGIDTIQSDQLIQDFSLSLEVGSCDTVDTCATFTAFNGDAEVDVGTNVNVKLDYTDTTGSFVFVMRECSVTAKKGADTDLGTIGLFVKDDDTKLHCPNEDASILSLVWRNYDRYSLNVFRVGDADSLTFSCKVAVYPDGKAPDACPSSTGRRRRSATFNPAGGVTQEISRTINLSDLREDSGAISLYADFVMSTIFALALV